MFGSKIVPNSSIFDSKSDHADCNRTADRLLIAIGLLIGLLIAIGLLSSCMSLTDIDSKLKMMIAS